MKSGPKANDETPAALYYHCESLYKAMIEEARTIVNEDDSTMVVWEGMLVHLVTAKLHLSVPYFTTITKALKRMGCIRQIRRGGGTSPSLWEIIEAPSLEKFMKDLPIREHKQGRIAGQQDQIDAILGRLAIVETYIANMIRSELGDANESKITDHLERDF